MPLLTPSTFSSTVRYYVTPPYILPNTCCQGFGQLVAAFAEQNVTHDMLPELSDNDMRELKNPRFSPIYDTIFTMAFCLKGKAMVMGPHVSSLGDLSIL